MALTGYAPTALVQGIQRQPIPYGLFSVLTFRPGGATRWENGVRWESGTCEPLSTLGAPECAPNDNGLTTGPGWPKKLDANGEEVSEATPFTVYGHYTCSAPSHSIAEAEDLARTHLVTREEAAAERELWTGELTGDGLLTREDVEDFGHFSAEQAAIALGVLENHIATTYGSLGVLHMPRSLAILLVSQNLLTATATRLTTVLGTPVVAGAGYPADTTNGAGQIFATPALLGYRSEIFTPSDRPGDLIDRTNNTLHAIAERTYLLGFDPCGVATAFIDTVK